MESNDPRQRQSNQQGYPGQQGVLPQATQVPPTSTPDRFRAAGVQQSPTLGSSASGRAGQQQYGTYGYGSQYVSTMPTSSLQYAQSYTQDSSRSQQSQQQQQQPTQQTQSYGGYTPGLMYGVSSQHQTQSPASPYEAVQTYAQQPRQPSGMQVLSSQFGVTPQYYMPGADAGSSSAVPISTQSLPSQYAPILYSQSGQSSRPRNSLGSPYGTELPKLPTAQSQSQQYQDQDYATGSEVETDAAYSQYQTELRKTHASVHEGKLSEAGASLMSLTEWLLGNAEALNLTRDDESVYTERLKLWEELNNCWLVTLQKQVDMTTEAVQNGQRIQHPQSIMSSDALSKMGDDLVRLCDAMEKHGLVDYQLGVWEESIVELLSRCLDKLEAHDRTFGATHPGPTTSRRR